MTAPEVKITSFDRIAACRDMVKSAVLSCVESGSVTQECEQRCPVLLVNDETYAGEQRLVLTSIYPERLVELVEDETTDWLGVLDQICSTVCTRGPIGEPHDWGEIDGQRAAGTSYLCAVVRNGDEG